MIYLPAFTATILSLQPDARAEKETAAQGQTFTHPVVYPDSRRWNGTPLIGHIDFGHCPALLGPHLSTDWRHDVLHEKIQTITRQPADQGSAQAGGPYPAGADRRSEDRSLRPHVDDPIDIAHVCSDATA
ncbi:hypothetical protein D3C85_1487030 [compost metagenome]